MRRRFARGSRAALLLGALVLALTSCSATGAEKDLRFGFPTGVTKEATKIRVLWTWAGVTALALGVIMWGLIFWCCIRYRKKSDKLPRQVKYNSTVEVICFTFPFIIIAGLFYRTVIVEDYVNKTSARPDVLVQVDAFKWNWQFEYHQYRTVPNSPTATTLSYPGKDPVCTNAIDENDNKPKTAAEKAKCPPYYISTTGQSDVIPILVIPVNKSVQIIEHSDDVIHSFWVPEFLFKRDVLPYASPLTNRDNRFQITATREGSYVGRCAELCGVYHSQMNFEVRVVSWGTFVNYTAELKKLGPANPGNQAIALKAVGMKPYATTTYPLDTNRTAKGPAKNPRTTGD